MSQKRFDHDDSSCGGIRRSVRVSVWLAAGWMVFGLAIGSSGRLYAQAPGDRGAASVEASNPRDEDRVKIGYLIDVPLPIDSRVSSQLINQLENLASSALDNQRVCVVLRFLDDGQSVASADTEFEDGLKLARALTSPRLQRVKVVAWVLGTVRGHTVLPILAAENLLVGRVGVITDASIGENNQGRPDPTVQLSYRVIAEQRGLFAPAVVDALVDPGLELALISKLGGEQVFASGEELASIRQSGQVLGESVWSPAGAPLSLNAKRLRTAQIASNVADSSEQAAEILDLAEIRTVSDQLSEGKPKGVLLDITGSIAEGRARRWQSNLASTLRDDDINTWLIAMDSGGGSLNESATLAGWFASPEPPLLRVAGLIRGEARGDAALIALACRPLYMTPEARIGGPGADSITADDLAKYDELIESIAGSTRRSSALIRGILDPTSPVYRFTNRKTGRIRYATEDDLVRGVEDAALEKEKWLRGEAVDLADGLSVTEAIALGLVDGEVRSLQDAAQRIGFDGIPPQVSDRGIVRLVERIGRSTTLAFLLLFVGFAALSAEANSPGLGLPGFVAMLCFGLYFWMKFLAGTAEWLELVAFTLGIACIAIEIFVVPGFGVFGVGGLALTVLGIVLMSQTFVVPRNVYQLEVLTRGVWVALGGAAGLLGGFVVMRLMFHHVPLFRGLVMEPVDQVVLEESEKLADYSHLVGQTGTATTPLRPSGKVRFGEQVVQVVSDGTAIGIGDRVRVSEVHATRIVVEPVEFG